MCSYDWNVEMCDILLAEWLGASLVNCPLPTKQCFLFTTHDSYSIVIAIVTGGHETWKLYSLRLVTCTHRETTHMHILEPGKYVLIFFA